MFAQKSISASVAKLHFAAGMTLNCWQIIIELMIYLRIRELHRMHGFATGAVSLTEAQSVSPRFTEVI